MHIIAVYCWARTLKTRLQRHQATPRTAPGPRRGRSALIQELRDPGGGGAIAKKKKKNLGGGCQFFFFLAPPPPPELESGQSSPTKTLDPVARLCRQKPTETDKRAPRSRGGGGGRGGGVNFFFFGAPPPPPPPELESGQSSPTKTLDPVARLCRQKPTETDKRAPRSRGGGGGRQ